MTTTRDQHARFVNAIAAAMCVLRPDWDQPGCVAALRKVPDVPLSQLGIAAMKYAEDRANLTPEWLSSLENRAWDSDAYPPCTQHRTTARRTNGQCAACWADAQEKPAPPMDRGGRPIPEEARAAMLAAISTQHEIRPNKRGPLPPSEARESARAELEAARKSALSHTTGATG